MLLTASESLAVPFAAPAGRRHGGDGVHGLCGRDILQLDGCGSCALLCNLVCLSEDALVREKLEGNNKCCSTRITKSVVFFK